MPRKFSIPAELLAGFLCLILGGCLGLGERAYPGKKVRRAVEEGQAFVFFGFDDNVAEKDLELRAGRSTNIFNIIEYALVNVDTGEEYSTVRGLSLFDGPDKGEIWSGVTVSPGTYFLHVIPPILTDLGTRWNWRDNRYLLRVPEGSKAIYAGTFVADCATEKQFLTGTTLVDCDTHVAIRNDVDRARAAIADWPGAPPELIAATPEPLSRPVPEEAAKAARRAELRITAANLPVLYPRWRLFDNETEPERQDYLSAGIRAALYKDRGPGCNSEGCLALFFLAVPIVAVIEAGKAVDAANEKSEWAACFDTARDRAASYPLAEKLPTEWERVKSTVDPVQFIPADGGNPGAEGPSRELTFNLYRLALRKCREKEMVCVEMALRVELGQSGAPPDFERMYVYTAAEFGPVAVEPPHRFAEMPAHPWWEEIADRHSTPRHISDFCGEGGEEALTGELDRGIAALLEKLGTDLAGAGGA